MTAAIHTVDLGGQLQLKIRGIDAGGVTIDTLDGNVRGGRDKLSVNLAARSGPARVSLDVDGRYFTRGLVLEGAELSLRKASIKASGTEIAYPLSSTR